MDRRDLTALIDALDATTAAIASVATDPRGSAANDLVHARRRLASQSLEMSRALEVALVSPLSSLQSVEAARLRATYHQRRNEARAAIADHQAKWPAVEMSKGIEVYRADVGRLHTDQQAFRSWLRNEFIPIAASLVRV